MGKLFIFLIGVCFAAFAQAQELAWQSRAFSTKKDLTPILQILSSSHTGQDLLNLAQKRDPQFKQHLLVGKNSVTESTLQRSLDLASGREWLDLRQVITLNERLTLADAVLDLAHELTHFAYRTPMNPYDFGFEQSAFIRHGIEAKGGELDAFLSECKVAQELRLEDASFPRHTLCERYEAPDGSLSRERARQDFYCVGAEDLAKLEILMPKIPELKSDRVIFRSSHAGTAYPLALAKEYLGTRLEACRNNAKRLELIQSHASAMQHGQVGRAPASLEQEAVKIKSYQNHFCGERSLGEID